MKSRCTPWLGLTLLLASAACGGSTESDGGGGTATVTIAGKAFNVSNVEMSFEPGEDGYFKIGGDDAANPDKDCVPGLAGGLSLYGGVPSTITSLEDFAGKELPFEFTGDGDDANLCFIGSNGLLGVEAGTVQFTAVAGDKVTFTFSGSFKVYDGQGGESAAAIDASGSGTARAAQ